MGRSLVVFRCPDCSSLRGVNRIKIKEPFFDAPPKDLFLEYAEKHGVNEPADIGMLASSVYQKKYGEGYEFEGSRLITLEGGEVGCEECSRDSVSRIFFLGYVGEDGEIAGDFECSCGYEGDGMDSWDFSEEPEKGDGLLGSILSKRDFSVWSCPECGRAVHKEYLEFDYEDWSKEFFLARNS